MKKYIENNRRPLLITLAVALLFAFCLAGFFMRQNYISQQDAPQQYVTLTEMQHGHIQHIQVTKERLKQIDADARAASLNAIEEVNRQRNQK